MRNVLKDILYLSGNRLMYKRLYFIGVVAYIIMLIFSVLFYKERTILVDTANVLFYIIKNKSFAIAIYRFGNIFNQFAPVIAVRSGASLNMIMGCYSTGFIFYYFTCYFITGSILKRYDLALAILLLNTLFVADTFYWIPSELPQGIALLMIILALTGNKNITTMKPLKWVILALAMIILAFYHPLLVFVIAYCILFLFRKNDIFQDNRFLFLIGGTFILIIILKSIFLSTPYERHSASGMKNFITLFPDYFMLYSNRQFLHNCLTKYYWIPIVFAGTVILYCRAREWKNLGVFLCFFFGYLLLINVSYPTSATPGFYIENLYLPLSVFLSLPFLYVIVPFLSKYKLALPVFVLVLVSSCTRIYTTHNFYAARLDWERKFLDEHKGRKMIYPASRTPADTVLMAWGTPYEFWLLSTTEQGTTASIIIDDKPELRPWAALLRKSLVVNWGIFPYSELNPKYFHFTDTTTGYEIIK